MHFFYFDESGDTGTDLQNGDQPILVLGGVSVKDTGWMTTQAKFAEIVDRYFDTEVPDDFELHAVDLLSPQGGGPFAGQAMDRRTELATEILNLVRERGHAIHYLGVDKASLLASNCEAPVVYDHGNPWLLAYDYLITYINWYVKERLGQSARGMVIHDEKTELQHDIERIAHDRRFEGAKSHRVKWVVEFSYPVDSRKNAMIQLSDLITYCTRRFLEIESGYRPSWTMEAQRFYAECFAKIDDRVAKKGLVERGGQAYASLNEHLGRARSLPAARWRSQWGVG